MYLSRQVIKSIEKVDICKNCEYVGRFCEGSLCDETVYIIADDMLEKNSRFANWVNNKLLNLSYSQQIDKVFNLICNRI